MPSPKLEDNICPICMYIYIQPVTMPCGHELCLPCFEKNVQESSLTCPLCRTRISSWARKAARNKQLVNYDRWKDIQLWFPEHVQKRLNGEDTDDDTEVFYTSIHLAEPGEIRKEYEDEIKKLEQQQEMEKRKEAEASEALIRKFAEEDEKRLMEEEKRRQELRAIQEQDEILAKELSQVMNEKAMDSPMDMLLRESRSRLASRSTSSKSSRSGSLPTLESFINKMKETDSAGNPSPYPYRCMTPTNEGKIIQERSKLLQLEEEYSRLAKKRREDLASKTESEFINLEERYNQESISRSGSISSISTVDTIPCDRDELLRQMAEGLNLNFDLREDCHMGKSDTESIESGMSKKSIKSTSSVTKENARSLSSQSNDSITHEMSHFRPIQSCARTPPRRLPSGKVVEAPLITTTPRNLSRTGFGSPNETNLSDIDAASPIMQRRLSTLAEERKNKVNRMSKATATASENMDDSENRNPHDKSESPHPHPPVLQRNLNSSASNGRSADLKDISNSPKQNRKHSSSSDVESDNKSAVSKKLLIPLEPVFDDDVICITPDIMNGFKVEPAMPYLSFPAVKHEKNDTESYESAMNPSEINIKREFENKSSDSVSTNSSKGEIITLPRKRNLSKRSRTAKTEAVRETSISPQRSITDWVKRTKTEKDCNIGSTSEIFSGSLNFGHGRDEVDGEQKDKRKRGMINSERRTRKILNSEDSPSKRVRKERKDPDFLYGIDASPSKIKQMIKSRSELEREKNKRNLLSHFRGIGLESETLLNRTSGSPQKTRSRKHSKVSSSLKTNGKLGHRHHSGNPGPEGKSDDEFQKKEKNTLSKLSHERVGNSDKKQGPIVFSWNSKHLIVMPDSKDSADTTPDTSCSEIGVTRTLAVGTSGSKRKASENDGISFGVSKESKHLKLDKNHNSRQSKSKQKKTDRRKTVTLQDYFSTQEKQTHGRVRKLSAIEVTNDGVSCESDVDQETKDRLYAEQLQRQFEMEMKYNLNAVRMKGSGEEYSFRRRTKQKEKC